MKARWIVLSLVVLFCSSLAFAGANCNTATVLNADGRVLDFDFVGPTSGPHINYYQFNVSAGRSYSVEVREDYDDLQSPTSDIQTAAFTDNNCTMGLTTNDTHNNDPILPGNAQRFSFTQGATGGTVYLAVTNNSPSTGRYVSVTVSETTLYNARWSTFSGFVTQWGFQNTCSLALNVKMVATDTLGSPIAPAQTITFGVPGNSETFHITAPSDVNFPAQHAGFAVITHDGPPGCLLMDAYFIGGNSTIIVPTTVAAVRQASH